MGYILRFASEMCKINRFKRVLRSLRPVTLLLQIATIGLAAEESVVGVALGGVL